MKQEFQFLLKMRFLMINFDVTVAVLF